jgi:type IV secretion system protein VirB6
MIVVSSFLTDTLGTVDAVIGSFVKMTYHNLVLANSGIITSIFTFYVILLGYRFVSHTETADLATIMRRMVVMLCVYSLIMRWDLYNIFIYNVFTNEPGNIAKVLVKSSGQMQSGSSIYQALDNLYCLVIDSSKKLFAMASLNKDGLCFILYGLLVFSIGTVMCVIALLLFIYSKMVMAIGLALGPLFILGILFEGTKGPLVAWINKLITTALIPIVTSAILILMLSVINVTLPNMGLSPEKSQFNYIAPFLGLSLATALILSQVLSICSSLGGGITLASLSKGVDLAKSALEKSGMNATGRKAADISRKWMGQPKKKFVAR